MLVNSREELLRQDFDHNIELAIPYNQAMHLGAGKSFFLAKKWSEFYCLEKDLYILNIADFLELLEYVCEEGNTKCYLNSDGIYFNRLLSAVEKGNEFSLTIALN